MLALSMGGAYAAGKVGPNDILNNAVRSHHIASGNVTTPDLKGRAVTQAKLAHSARAAKVIRYTSGPHNFAADPTFYLPLPGGKGGVAFQNLGAAGPVDAIRVFQTIPLTTKAAAAGSAKSQVAPGARG